MMIRIKLFAVRTATARSASLDAIAQAGISWSYLMTKFKFCVVAAVIGSSIVSAVPAQAAINHVWPACAKTTNEAGWRYSTFKWHNPYWAVDINWGTTSASDRGRIVVASAQGTIVKNEYYVKSDGTGYGGYVKLRHDDGTPRLTQNT